MAALALTVRIASSTSVLQTNEQSDGLAGPPGLGGGGSSADRFFWQKIYIGSADDAAGARRERCDAMRDVRATARVRARVHVHAHARARVHTRGLRSRHRGREQGPDLTLVTY